MSDTRLLLIAVGVIVAVVWAVLNALAWRRWIKDNRAAKQAEVDTFEDLAHDDEVDHWSTPRSGASEPERPAPAGRTEIDHLAAENGDVAYEYEYEYAAGEHDDWDTAAAGADRAAFDDDDGSFTAVGTVDVDDEFAEEEHAPARADATQLVDLTAGGAAGSEPLVEDEPPFVLRSISADAESVLLVDVDDLVVGRSRQQADVVCANSDVSRRHCRLRSKRGVWWVGDLGSTNGTWVNGERLGDRKPVRLHDGDTVRLGATATFRLEAYDAEPASHAAG